MEIKIETKRENVEKLLSSFISKDPNMKVIDLLIQFGADPKEFGYSFNDIITMLPTEASSVLYDQLKNRIPDIWLIRNLIQHTEVDVNMQNKWGESLLMIFIKIMDKEIIKLLLANPKTNVNLQDKSGRTALMWASDDRHTLIVKSLLERPEIDVNLQDKRGRTALMHTCSFRCNCKNFFNGYNATCRCKKANNNTKIAKLLIERIETDVNVQDLERWTPLMEASKYGNQEIVKMLLQRSDIDITIKRGDRTAWSTATPNIRQNYPNLKPAKKKFIPYLQRLGKV